MQKNCMEQERAWHPVRMRSLFLSSLCPYFFHMRHILLGYGGRYGKGDDREDSLQSPSERRAERKILYMSNKLISEKSPYLLQHAENPVDWYPWCDEAFCRAKAENKPVFLSVG